MLFLLNIKFISLVRQNSVTFSLVLRTYENITEFCLTREINLIFNKTTLNILYISTQINKQNVPYHFVHEYHYYKNNIIIEIASYDDNFY